MNCETQRRWQLSAICWTVVFLFNSFAASEGFGQKLEVRTKKAPFFVGENIALEVDAVDFDDKAIIEIANSKQADLNLSYRNSGRSESTQIFQSGGKLVRNRIVKTTYYYSINFEKPGEYTVGPFEANYRGKKYSYPAITFSVKDIETTNDMRVDLIVPKGKFYPGQKVPVEIRWQYSGDPRLVRGLNIRSSFFDQFRFQDEPFDRRDSTIPITTNKGTQSLKAVFKRERIDEKEQVVGIAKRIMIPDQPAKIDLPAIFVSFQKIVGARRSADPFNSFFNAQPETRPYRGIGSEIKFEVSPFPDANRPESFLGAVGKEFELTSAVNRNSVRTGDPLTLQLNIKGEGNLDSIRLPDLDSSFSEKDFEWPKGDVAGVTKDNQKQFLLSLRVKTESVKEIPPIEFSWFDPVKEEYCTSYSTPIPLDVSKGEVVSSDDVISRIGKEFRATDGPSSNADSVDLSIETSVDKLMAKQNLGPLSISMFYVGGTLLLGLVFITDRYRKKAEQSNGQRDIAQGCFEEIRNLNEEATIEQLSQALRALQRRTSEPESGPNFDAEFKASLDSLIGSCDAIAYRPSGPTSEEQKQLVQQAKSLIEDA